MKTKIDVTINLEIKHEGLTIQKLEKLALSNMHNSKLSGCSIRDGSYKVTELNRSSKIEEESK